MFGLGKKVQPETPKQSIPVVTIPAEFYAGANPTITFREVEKVITPQREIVMPKADKQAFDQKTAAGNGQPLHPASLFSNRKKLLLIGGGLFVVFVGIGGAYYWLQTKPADQKRVVVSESKLIIPTITPTTSVQAEVLPPPPATTEQTIPILTEGRLEFPSLLSSKAVDLDNDGLTDAEEEFFKSDPGVPDTDDDSYLDGGEVYHLYNPVGKEPIKLIESGTVLEFINPAFGYGVYYPVGWAVGNVDGGYRDMLFSAITGDNVEIRVFDKTEAQNFSDWLVENAPTQSLSEINDFTSRFGETGYNRSDELVYYFVTPTKVYAFVYHTDGSNSINYPAVIEMMARSFRRDASLEAVLPPQPPGV